MTIYDELQARGLLAQLTDEEEIKELINNGKATFYIGFDPTADSLHVGHFMTLCLTKRLQEAGNKPIVLIGGGTAMIGDPTGRTDLRQMLTKEQINNNIEHFKVQMSRFINFSGEDGAIMVNNADWLLDLNYVEVLREVGACFSVNKMLTAECFKQRLEKGMTLEQVAVIVGVGKSTVRKWETGMIANMKRDKIALLAKALSTTPAYLMGWKEETPAEKVTISDKEKLLLDLFKQVPENKQEMVIQMIQVALNT